MNKQQGITLIELMVVMMIIGIIAAIAVPSYSNHMRKTRRNMAAGCLQENAQFLERWYTSRLTYEGAVEDDSAVVACQPEIEGFYEVTVDITGPRSFTATAEPQGSQVKDICGTLTLDERGRRTSEGPDDKCW